MHRGRWHEKGVCVGGGGLCPSILAWPWYGLVGRLARDRAFVCSSRVVATPRPASMGNSNESLARHAPPGSGLGGGSRDGRR